MRITVLAAVAALLASGTACGQADRYELGRRLVAFEQAWDRSTDAGAKKKAVGTLNEVVGAFFSFRLREAGRLLDEARRRLTPDQPSTPAAKWADALAVQPRARLVDATAPVVEVAIKKFYEVKGDPPARATLRLRPGDGPTAEFPLGALPSAVALPLIGVPGPRSADLALVAEISVGAETVCRRTLTLSRVEHLHQRLAALDPSREPLASSRTIEALTAAATHALLKELADGRVRETDYPTARLLAEAEASIAALEKRESYYGPQRPGQFWLTAPLEKGSAFVRIFIPDGLSREKPAPAVVALHGAGGTENLFFEGYGDGITLKECRKRGWILIAPRAGFGFGFAPPVPQIVDALAKVYPIDVKRIFLVGHSMGAGHAAALSSLSPERFAAAALLGGGGLIRGDKIKQLPIFVGCGVQDFALRGARGAHAALVRAEAARAVFKEYPDVEHVTIVRAAADDVFAFFESAVRP